MQGFQITPVAPVFGATSKGYRFNLTPIKFAATYSYTVARQRLPYLHAVIGEARQRLPFTMRVETRQRLPFLHSVFVEARQRLPFWESIETRQRLPFRYDLATELRQRLPFLVAAVDPVITRQRLAFGHRLSIRQRIPFALELQTEVQQRLPFLVRDADPVTVHQRLAFGHHLSIRQRLPFALEIQTEVQQRLPFLVREADPVFIRQRLAFGHRSNIRQRLAFAFEIETALRQRLPFAVREADPVFIRQRLAFAHRSSIRQRLVFAFEIETALRQRLPFAVREADPVFIRQRLAFGHRSNIRQRLAFAFEIETTLRQRLPFAVREADPVFIRQRLAFGHRSNIRQRLPFAMEVQTEVRQRLPYGEAIQVDLRQRLPFAVLDYSVREARQRLPFRNAPLPISIILPENLLIHRGSVVPLEDYALSASEDTAYWSGSVRPARPTDFDRLSVGEHCTLVLQGIHYELMVQSRSYNRREVADGFELKLASATAQLATQKITKTWPQATANDIANELAGHAVDWQLKKNWLLPAGTLNAAETSRLDLLKQLAAACGGIVSTQANGTIQLQPRTRKRMDQLTNSDAQHNLLKIYSYDEQPAAGDHYNSLVLRTSEPQGDTDYHYKADYLECDKTRGFLRVYAEPWRHDLSLSTTGHPSIVIGNKQLKYWEELQEIEFKEGKATLSFPVWERPEVTWQHRDLGTIQWRPGSKDVFASGGSGYSVGWVRYKTRAFLFPITHRIQQVELSQFLIHAPAEVQESGLVVQVQRGFGHTPKPDLVSPLSTDLAVLLELGRIEMDLGLALPDATLTLPYQNMQVGDITQAFDHRTGSAWLGAVKSITHGMGSDGDLETRAILRRAT